MGKQQQIPSMVRMAHSQQHGELATVALKPNNKHYRAATIQQPLNQYLIKTTT
jgi:hypothetical protein